jgi:general secretion pathway protein I
MGSETPSSQSGFTLLEVLVAFVIAALALGVLFQGAIEGLAAVHLADRTTEALNRAQSHLASVGHGIPLRTQTQQGEDGSGFHWSVAIRPLQSAALVQGGGGDAQHPMRETLFEVRVTESWDGPQGQRGSTLTTRRAAITPVQP